MDLDQPQKPKTTKDGKQMEGPAYSTRSKAKRTYSHSNDKSTGSQAHLPQPKRRIRQGAKQVNKSVGINNEDSAPIDSNTVDEYSAAEIALRNDLVLESLLRHMNKSDLLSCRVVNKQWQYEATKELRRRKLVIRFSFQSQGNEVSRDKVFQKIFRRLSQCKTPSLLSSVQVKTDAFNNLGSAGVRKIFTTVGNQLKYLKLHLSYLGKRSSFKGSSLMTDLHNLLFRQAPNLEFLEIKFDFPYNWKKELQALNSSDRLQDDNNELRLLPNLKTFIVDGTPPPNFFADVIKAAVNLRSLGGVWSSAWCVRWRTTAGGDLSSFVGFSSACIEFFLGAEGRDKIHLLNSFKVYLADGYHHDENDKLDIELLEKFLTEHKQNLQLETFECVSSFCDDDASFAPRIVDAINQILESSSGSLQKLRIKRAQWFDDIVYPRLPNLKEISFDCFRRIPKWPNVGGVGFVPPGVIMTHSFPNVSTIALLRCNISLFCLFVRRMRIEMTEPVPSVRHIIMINPGKGIDTLRLGPDFQRVFPNLLSISYVDNENYPNM